MEVKHLVELLSQLTPNLECKYVRSDEKCMFVKVDETTGRLYTKTPEGKDFEFAPSFIQSLAESIKENEPFSTSQLLNNKGSNRAVIDSIIAHTSEFYWMQDGRSRYTIWIPSKSHNSGELVEWTDIDNLKELPKVSMTHTYSKHNQSEETTSNHEHILRALRTKPFLLLAGISGTGKSRVVRELAFKSCPEYLQDEDGTTPGNYCMIEVKPNWHDSSELLGYYSHISKEYQYTNFIKFLVKAMMFSEVPFFVCLDEMNLAPVEQYFAEFLSVLETRKKTGTLIRTGALVKPEYFAELGGADNGDGYVFKQWFPEIQKNIPYNIYTNPTLARIGLTLPSNVFIIGTVNMDDTTHQFSRKVLDRAMTIEMNGGKLSDMFGQSHNLEYLPEENIWDIEKFKPKYITADEVIEAHQNVAEELKTKLPERLEEINEVLKDTPFVVSYRVLNELVIYTGNLLNDGKSIEEAIDEAVNQIVLMKILPRIEGDEDMFIVKGAAENRLEQLAHLVSGATKAKLEEMNNRLSTGFTRFWP